MDIVLSPQKIANQFLAQKTFIIWQCSWKNKKKELLKDYTIDNPDSQVLLEHAQFQQINSVICFQQKSLQLFYDKKYTSKEFQQAIAKYSEQVYDSKRYLQQYKQSASKRKMQFSSRYKVSEEDAYGCCLALSYYTGSYSQRLSRSSNLMVRSNVVKIQDKIEKTVEYTSMKCIVYWLMRALHYIPLHWGEVTRCVDLKNQQKLIYQTGNIVTWIQFSSSSYGKPTQYFSKRNTVFKIYSLSGRCIQKFSNYGNETEVLFKPFSHFLVFKTQNKNEKFIVYMRQIFFGQSKKNVLWVDDNIFNKDWQNKKLMEQAIIKQPLLSIVPKNSTSTGMAFVKSHFCRNRKPHEFRIISDMNRNNQLQSYNAGARFAKQFYNVYQNIHLLIYTSNEKAAIQQLQQLKVNSSKIKVTVSTLVAKQFLDFK